MLAFPWKSVLELLVTVLVHVRQWRGIRAEYGFCAMSLLALLIASWSPQRPRSVLLPGLWNNTAGQSDRCHLNLAVRPKRQPTALGNDLLFILSAHSLISTRAHVCSTTDVAGVTDRVDSHSARNVEKYASVPLYGSLKTGFRRRIAVRS